ncbi:hypothetical protein HDU97_000414 [Phlyctochytrium planicorne]|nr:hypothetical protein HDU97_000414 [Phlyctochytrium planicorne]
MTSETSTPAQLTTEQKVQKGKDEKDLGNTAFKEGNIQEALRHYHLAILFLTGLDNAHLKSFVGGSKDLDESIKTDIKATINTCHTNMAACHLKNGNFEKAIKSCDKVLDKTPDNTKAHRDPSPAGIECILNMLSSFFQALFRRGKANLELKNLDKAEADLKKAAELEPKDGGIRAELQKIKAIRLDYEKKQKKEWAGMFDRK